MSIKVKVNERQIFFVTRTKQSCWQFLILTRRWYKPDSGWRNRNPFPPKWSVQTARARPPAANPTEQTATAHKTAEAVVLPLLLQQSLRINKTSILTAHRLEVSQTEQDELAFSHNEQIFSRKLWGGNRKRNKHPSQSSKDQNFSRRVYCCALVS